MIERAPDAVRAVFIHDAVSTPADERARLCDRNIHLFDTYVEAARVACNRGLVALGAVARIAQAAREELERIEFASDAEREARRADLLRDIEAAGL